MTGKAYYITTLADWQRHAARFANSHFIVLEDRASAIESTAHVADASSGAGLKPSPTTDNAEAVCDHRQPSARSSDPAPLAAANEEPGMLIAQKSHPVTLTVSHDDPAPLAARGDDRVPLAGATQEKPTRILVLIEADEGVHLSLEDEQSFEALPHPLAQKRISDAAQAALSAHGVVAGATTFDAAEAAARVHPLLRHRVF